MLFFCCKSFDIVVNFGSRAYPCLWLTGLICLQNSKAEAKDPLLGSVDQPAVRMENFQVTQIFSFCYIVFNKNMWLSLNCHNLMKAYFFKKCFKFSIVLPVILKYFCNIYCLGQMWTRIKCMGHHAFMAFEVFYVITI